MIAVCGAGSWGTALAIVLAHNLSGSEKKVVLWGRNAEDLAAINTTGFHVRYLPDILLPQAIMVDGSLESVFKKSQDIVIAVPSHGFVDFIQSVKPYVSRQHRLVFATKGLEPATGRFLHQVIEDELGKSQACGILSGPSFAREVALQLPTAVTIGTLDKQFLQDLVGYFHCDTFRVYTSDDLVGIQLGGVVKNVLAVATGISDGLQLGANARSALITRGFAEMLRLGEKVGARSQTLMGLSGIGDIILTCTDDQSRNRRFGRLLAEGKSIEQAQQEINQVIEALHNTQLLCQLAAGKGIEMPIAEQVWAVLSGKTDIKAAGQALLCRDPKSENYY